MIGAYKVIPHSNKNEKHALENVVWKSTAIRHGPTLLIKSHYGDNSN